MSTRLDAVEEMIQQLSDYELDMIRVMASIEEHMSQTLPDMERVVQILLENLGVSGASLRPETLNEESLADELEKKLRDKYKRYSRQAKIIKELEMEGDKLRSENCLLEFLVCRGDSSPENTEVNAKIEALRAQLEEAKSRLESIEELRAQPGARDWEEVDGCIAEETGHLNARIAKLEERQRRYKAVYADRLSFLTRECFSLFGYKIVMKDGQRANGTPVTRFNVQSIYAPSEDEKAELEFEFENESGRINILENAYTSQPEISQSVRRIIFFEKLMAFYADSAKVEEFIHDSNSVPAFTAHITALYLSRLPP